MFHTFMADLMITHMNKGLCYFGFCLLLLTGCTSCKEQKEILIGTIGRIDTSRATPVLDRLDSLKQAAAQTVNKVPYLDSASLTSSTFHKHQTQTKFSQVPCHLITRITLPPVSNKTLLIST